MTEQQYIDIYTQHKDLINSKSAPVINSLRDKALEAFSKNGFPTNRLEDYKNIDIEAEFQPDFGLNFNRVPLKGNPYFAFKCEVPNLSTNLYYVLNDIYSADYLPKAEYPKGVYVGGLKDFALQYPDICKRYYGQIADANSNGIVAINTLFTQDGFVVYVPKNTVIEKPIQVINVLKSEISSLVSRRILLIVEDNAQAKLLVCDHTMDNTHFLVTQTTEIYAGKNAVIDYYEMEENSDNVTRLTATYTQQEETSNVLVNNLTLNCGRTRNNYYFKLQGENSEANVCGIVITEKDQYVDNFVFMDHAKPNCQSNQLFKYVLQDRSTGVFCGRILVEKDAQKTLAYQNNRNLCASPEAQMYSKPQLEIYADDVKCSHGLTTGQLNEDALFYLRSRGIGKEDARLLLMQAFAADVLEHVRIEGLRERLQDLIERRFRGESARCGNCEICK